MAVTSSRNARSAWAKFWYKLTTLNPLFLTLLFFISMIFPLAVAYNIELGRLWGFLLYTAVAFGGTIVHAFDAEIYENPLFWAFTKIVGWGYSITLFSTSIVAYTESFKWWMLFILLTSGYLVALYLKLNLPKETMKT